MANKTQPNNQNVDAFVASVEDPVRQQDMRVVMQMITEISGQKPVMWGDSIVGFGRYAYTYASGRKGEFFILGLSPRKQNLTLYIMPGYQDYSKYLHKLGNHKTGKCCLYIKKLTDVDVKVLRQLLVRGWHDMLERNIPLSNINQYEIKP